MLTSRGNGLPSVATASMMVWNRVHTVIGRTSPMARKTTAQPFWLWPAVAVVSAMGIAVLILYPLIPSMPMSPGAPDLVHDGTEGQRATPMGATNRGS